MGKNKRKQIPELRVVSSGQVPAVGKKTATGTRSLFEEMAALFEEWDRRAATWPKAG
jgi:hypothetical protein